MIFILAILVIIFFIVGFALILQGFFETPEAESTVARRDFDKLKDELAKSGAAHGQLIAQLDKITLEFNQAKDDGQKARLEAEAGEIHRRENAVLTERLRQTEENLHILRSVADRQAKEAAEAITNLQGENRQLAEEVKLSAGKIPAQELDKLHAEKKVLQSRIDEQVGRMANLEEEIVRQRNDAGQNLQKIQADSQVWQRDRLCLTEGLRSFINRLGEVSAAVAQLKSDYHLRWEESSQAVMALKEENAVLLEQIQRGARSVELEQQLKDDSQQSRTALGQAREQIQQLTAELENARQQMGSFQAAHASQVEKQVAEIRRKLQLEQTADKEQIGHLTGNLSQLRRDFEAAQISLQEKERAFVLLEQQAESNQQRTARLNTEIDALNAQLAGMMEERLRMEAQIQTQNQSGGDRDKILLELEDLRQQFEGLKEYCVLIQDEVVKYRSKAELLDMSYQEVLGEYEKITGAGRAS